ncbi:MAG: DedA family protein [Bacteroidetes bacterium QS_9_68_14]|nr:MAG: DedA family protein [Bacteroidetes bacterium QS_9_68_14]
MVVVFGGYLAGSGALSLPVVVALATLGGALGFMTVYAVGRRFGRVVLEPGRFRWVPQKRVEQAQGWIRRWGHGVVAANRFLTGARSVISLAVGVAQMNAWKTAFWATVSAAVWCTLVAYAGYALGENWRLIRQYLAEYSRGVLALLGAALLAWGACRLWQRRRADDDESAPPEERAEAASEKP